MTPKLIKTPTLLLLSANALMAQSLEFTTFSLESGTNLQSNSSYRFDDVLSGVDAIITVNSISANASLNQIDDVSAPGADFSAFRPIIRGVSPDGSNTEHSVSFSIAFVTANTVNSVSISNFGLSVYDTDGDGDPSDLAIDDGNILEFARLSGNLDTLGSNLQQSSLGGGVTQVQAINSTTNPGVTATAAWRSDWSYGTTSSFDATLGWVGNDNVLTGDNDRHYGLHFSQDSVVVPVPEPNSSALLGLGVLGLLVRRKR